MEVAMPAVFAEFVRATQLLERHYRDMQDMEFTVERGKLYMLQTRNGKRTAKAALRIAVEMANEGLITREEAVLRVEPASLDQLLHPTIDPKAKREDASPRACRPRPARPAARSCSTPTRPRRLEGGRQEGDPGARRDLAGGHPRHACGRGIVTTRGGMTSHAAVVARGMGKPCVSGAGAMRIDYARAGADRAGGRTFKAGRRHHHRRLAPARSWQGAVPMVAAGAVRRIRDADGLGRRRAAAEGARQRRHARSTRASPASSAPRASACAAPSTCSSTRTASSPCAR